ncbi:hypothetical protein BG841_09110 [Marinobacter sp. X15-166B]|nr:hypothetical protein BG841_09110 [Marinobacter sp. X15-166B]
MLLLMISSHEGVGGMEKHTQELANGLVQRGHRVTVMAAPQHLQLLAVAVTRVALNPRRSRRDPRQLFKIARFIGAEGFDIVHAQGTKAAALLRSLRHFVGDVRLMATIHGFKSRYPASPAFFRVIAVSQTLGNTIPGENIAVVYNGLDCKTLTAAHGGAFAAAGQRPVWLAAGRLVDAKGFDMLIDAFRTTGGCLYIAGDGPDRAALQTRINDYQLNGRVTLLGHRNDVPELMASCDGVVISSRREGFSYVFAEALLAGKPVIATDVPIANEFLPPQHIYKGHDAEGFSRLLNTNLSEVYEEQLPARKRAQTELTLNAMVQHTLDLYRAAAAAG